MNESDSRGIDRWVSAITGVVVRQDGGYGEPFFWYGPRPEPPARDIAALLRDGTIAIPDAALLWATLARRRSLVVVAEASGVGKTTLLTALLAFVPSATRCLYLRGCYETFAFLDDASLDPARTALLVNELSPHLPVYLWGPGVTRLLDAAARGFQLLATAHAASAVDFVASLAGGPLRVPTASVAAFDTVVALAPAPRTPSGRHVCGVWRLTAARDGITIDPALAPQCDASGDSTTSGGGNWFPLSELRQRAALLRSLRDGELRTLPAVAPPRESAPAAVSP